MHNFKIRYNFVNHFFNQTSYLGFIYRQYDKSDIVYENIGFYVQRHRDQSAKILSNN